MVHCKCNQNSFQEITFLLVSVAKHPVGVFPGRGVSRKGCFPVGVFPCKKVYSVGCATLLQKKVNFWHIHLKKNYLDYFMPNIFATTKVMLPRICPTFFRFEIRCPALVVQQGAQVSFHQVFSQLKQITVIQGPTLYLVFLVIVMKAMCTSYSFLD